MKAIQLCEWKGWSQAAALLEPAEGLTAPGEGSLSGDGSSGSFFCEPGTRVSLFIHFQLSLSNVIIFLAVRSVGTGLSAALCISVAHPGGYRRLGGRVCSSGDRILEYVNLSSFGFC